MVMKNGIYLCTFALISLLSLLSISPAQALEPKGQEWGPQEWGQVLSFAFYAC